MPRTVAALYVDPDGPYSKVEGVDLWPEARDARLYAGPHPVVAHPPCARWSSMAPLVEATHGHKRREDGGCFTAALAAVRKHGGILEHPAVSMAWHWFGLCKPPSGGGWVVADWEGGWTCCVAQRVYGHRARKRTWLYANGCELMSLRWGDGDEPDLYLTAGRNDKPGKVYSNGAPGRSRTKGEKMCGRERIITPEPFRDVLLAMARSVGEERR